MPITAQDKQQILAEAGVDSTKYWIDDNGEIIDMPAQGGFEAGAKSALYNAPRTLLGFVGGAGGAAGAGLLGLPSGPGAFVTGTAGALAGGATGGAIGDKIQSALYPAGWRFSEEARSVRNPMASFVGQTASQVALLRPSPKMLAQVAKAPGEFVRSGGQVTPATAGAVLNVLTGGAIMGGVALGSGAPMEDVAREAAIGALLSQPTKLGYLLSGKTFAPWKPSPTAAGSTGGMREAFQDRVAQQKTARAAEAAAINAQRRAAFDEAVARGEAPMPVDPVDPRESRMAPLEEELGVTSSEDWLAYLQDFGGKMKAKFAQADSVTADDGTPVAGRYTPRTGPGADASIDVSRSGYADTGPHEYLHAMIDDTLNYGTPREKAFMERVLAESGLSVEEVGGKRRVVGDLSEFTGPIEGGRARGEEDLVQRAGEDFVRRAVDPAKNDTFRGALKDFSEYYLKNRMTPEAAQRMLSGRLMHGRGTEPALRSAAGRAVRPLDLERERAEKLDLAEAAKLKAENDAREEVLNEPAPDPSARRRADVEAAFAARDKAEFEKRMAANMRELPESPLRTARKAQQDEFARARTVAGEEGSGELTADERLVGDMARFSDTGGEMPAGELAPTEVQTSVPYDIKPNEVAPGSAVSRPVNRDYSGESIPANAKRGRLNKQAAAESPEDLEMRRIEDRLSGRGRSKYQPLREDERPLKFRQTAGPFKDEVIVARSTREPGKWQATHFAQQEDGTFEPSGHDTYATRDEAVRSAKGENVNGRPSAGSKTFELVDTKYQPLGPDEGSYKGAKLPDREQPRRGIFAGNVEALRRSGNPDKKYFAERADELYARIRNYAGKYESEILKPLLELSSADQKLLVGHMYDEDAAGHRMPVASQLRPAYNAMRKGLELMARDQIAAGQLIGGKARGVKDSYFPNGVDTTIIHDLTYNSNSARAQELERQYIDYNADRLMAATPRLTRAKAEAEARDSFASFRGSLKPMSIENGFDFGAVTMKEGGKLPATWMAADPVAGLRNYIKRFARSRAFYDVIQRDERAMASLGMENFYDAAGAQQPVTVKADNLNRDPNARALMESAIGVTHESQEGITPAIGRLANSLLLSNVMTRVTDVATTPFKALAYIPASQVPGLIGHMSNMRKSIENAYRTGGVRRGDMMVIRDVLGAGDQMVRGMDKFSEQIVKWTGSEALEKGARFLAQNVGEYVYDVNVALANRGDKNATEFLNRLTPEWKNLAREEVAQRVAQLFQGRYDATNLPIWIANSPAAPFFSMMKWNIEQWNNFRRFAWQPAQQGNFRPLIGTLIGGALGGVAVGELREKISGKKQRVATLDELEFGFTEGDKGRTGMEAMRKAAFIAQVTGTFGVVGELALQALDIAAKDKPQGMSWPAFEMAANAIGKTQNAAAAMLEQPDDAGLIALNAAHDLMRDSFSQYRIAMGALDQTGVDVGLAGGADQIEESNRRRDMRMSDKLRGEKTRFSPFIEADYGKTREKRMDKTSDLAEARELGAKLKSQARERSKTRAEYDSELAKLRSSRIVGIPSKENNPVQYRAHVEFVRRTQGDEAAQALQETYRRLRGSQQRKASMFQ